MHNFAYHPGVASWVQSLDSGDEVTEHAPDDFYKSAVAHTHEVPEPNDMTATRQRQQTPNGAARSTAKPSISSVSGPATSTTSTPRSSIQQFNRPSVKSMAQKFNQPTSAESSPQSTRARPVRPPAASANSSPAQPGKEASYGSYKFNNLKPRDRPQPAPPSPASARGARIQNALINGIPSSNARKTPSRKKVASPTRNKEKGRQPFFGEVIGAHDAVTPGFGIPQVDGAVVSTMADPSLPAPSPGPQTIKIVTDDLPALPESHADALPPHIQPSTSDMASHRPVGDAQSQQSPMSESRRRSPPSRIPVPSSRRFSGASDSSSSTRSARFAHYMRPTAATRAHGRTSPTRPARAPVGHSNTPSKKSITSSSQPTLAAASYRGYRERGKSPQANGGSGPSVAAVITAPPPPTSPRLRNSRERQPLQRTPGSRSRSADPHGTQDYFGESYAPQAQDRSHMLEPGHEEKRLSVRRVEPSEDEEDPQDIPSVQQELDTSNHHLDSALDTQQSALHLTTEGLSVPPAGRPSSSATSFEESPILGMPGSFMMTPPLAQAVNTPPPNQSSFEQEKPQEAPTPTTPQLGGELLQARAFQPANKRMGEISRVEDAQDQSELGVRESIPIALGSEVSSPGWSKDTPKRPKHQTRLSIGSQTWRVEPLDASGTISYLDEDLDDSPIDPFADRGTLMPGDSASVAFYHQIGQQPPNWGPKTPEPQKDSFTLDSEAYSVINKILNVYHESDTITPQLAQDSWEQVQGVSPIVAQHRDWGSKEATETYLARLLSDASAGREEPSDREATPHAAQHAQHAVASAPSIRQLAADPDDEDEPFPGGTAIIFPSESRRYSRGSRASVTSATTTIFEGPSRPDSSSGLSARDRGHSNGVAHAPNPPPKDWSSPLAHEFQYQPLPNIVSAGEGLGLSLQQSQEQPHGPQAAPPKPAYSPPPPPNMGPVFSRLCPPDSDSFDDRPLLDRTPPDSPRQTRNNYGSTGGSGAIMAGVAPSLEMASASEPTSPTSPTPGSPEDTAEKEREKAVVKVRRRYRVIEELCKTEHSFCVDMMVAHQIFEGTSKEVLTDEERKLLFSNCKDLENFSHNLWKSLKDAIRPIVNQLPPEESSGAEYDEFVHCTPENDRQVKVGEVMLAFIPRMERVYTTYYLNYDDASKFIKANVQNPELLGWVMACFQHCPNLTTAWDLDSLLIKPVQRMLRYPLLLSELIEKTVPDHPDLAMLRQAKDAIIKIAERIDVAKKRQETLRAATSEGKKQKGKGSGDRNVKSIVKALRWSKEKAKTLQEAALIFEDSQYNQVTQKFGGHFFQIQIVIADMDQYLASLTESTVSLNAVMLGFITVSETGPSANAEMESTWRRWAMAHLDLQNKVLDEHINAVRNRVMKPISNVWDQWVGPQKLMEQRKKLLIQYAKYKQATDRKEKIDPKLEETAKSFLTINDSLKQELPMLYELTKKVVRLCSTIFIGLSKDWYKTCSKKILPLLEDEPQHTTSISYDFKTYQERFKSDFRQMEQAAKNLAIINHELINSLSNYMSPIPMADDASSRKSSSRRTESIGSEVSMIDRHGRNRNSGGYNSSRSGMHSFEGPPRSSPAATYGPGSAPPISYKDPSSSTSASSSLFRERPSSDRTHTQPPQAPGSYTSESTIIAGRPSNSSARNPAWANLGFDGAWDETSSFAPSFVQPASIGASFLQPMLTHSTTASSSHSQQPSQPGSSRTSGVFNSALPMSTRNSAEELPATPSDPDEPEVLFLAASLFEFNIAHDRREGGIPYLVYVPGEIFDVIGMKGELWLARNQDDPLRTVGWIWEKHFARILPEDA
ncbi:uncharacterized protein N0V89_012542 [Didymosphaeria variabile]|uniref:DH domain-containing protein n=1 Tax=Didymosphaeria variabile TaxID=1932322 RepID=A0A9W8X9F4_9PLEO|nr:uncharacterized protein N0V89_012542 [Didymosphaeria variabile]KAJ4344798.1 hypothetical protein N0V89_012542 [Didymosphaeria variabile]